MALPGTAPLPLDIAIEGVQVCAGGARRAARRGGARRARRAAREVEYEIGLPGEGAETEVFFSDLGHEYVTHQRRVHDVTARRDPARRRARCSRRCRTSASSTARRSSSSTAARRWRTRRCARSSPATSCCSSTSGMNPVVVHGGGPGDHRLHGAPRHAGRVRRRPARVATPTPSRWRRWSWSARSTRTSSCGSTATGSPRSGFAATTAALFRVAAPDRAGRRATSASSGAIERVDVDVLDHIAAGLHPGHRLGRRRPRGQLLQRQRRRGGRRRRARARRLQGHLPHRRRGLAARPGRPGSADLRGRRRRGRGGARRRSRGGMRPEARRPASTRSTAASAFAHIVDGRVPHSLLLELFTDAGHRHEDRRGGVSPTSTSSRRSSARTWCRPTRGCPVAFVRGEGARLWDAEGNEYLDFLAGLAVNSVGHCHPGSSRRSASRPARLHPRLATSSTPSRRCGSPSGWRELVARRQRVLLPTPAPRPTRPRSSWRARRRPRRRRSSSLARRLPRPHLRLAVGHAAGEQAGAVRAARARASSPSPPTTGGARRGAVDEHTAAVMLEPVQGESGV